MGYKFIKLLGKGSYGSVYLAKNESSQSTNDYVAIKKFSIRDKTSYTSFKNELKIFKKIESEYLIKILDYYKDSDYIYLVMEYAPHGDLEDYIRSFYSKRKKIDTKFVDTIIYQVSEGLKVLHKNNIIHRDIKTSNILIFNRNLIKITDFGISKILENNLFAKSSIGTPYYMSPEIIRGIPYDFSVDFWALGCLIYKVLTNYYPFEASNMALLISKIKSGKYNLSIIPNKYKMIVSKLINENLNRGTKKDINNFIISNCNTFVKMNNINLYDSSHVIDTNHTSANNKILPPLKYTSAIDNTSTNLKNLEIEHVKDYKYENKKRVLEPIKYTIYENKKRELEKPEKYTKYKYKNLGKLELEKLELEKLELEKLELEKLELEKLELEKLELEKQELEKQVLEKQVLEKLELEKIELKKLELKKLELKKYTRYENKNLKEELKYNIYRNHQLEPIKDNMYENKKYEYKSNINEPVIINHNIREYKKYEYKSNVNDPVVINHNIQSNCYESNKCNYEYYKDRNRKSNMYLNNLFNNKYLKPIKKNLNYKKSEEDATPEYQDNNFIKHNIKNVKKNVKKKYFKNMPNNIQKLSEINFRPPFRF